MPEPKDLRIPDAPKRVLKAMLGNKGEKPQAVKSL